MSNKDLQLCYHDGSHIIISLDFVASTFYVQENSKNKLYIIRVLGILSYPTEQDTALTNSTPHNSHILHQKFFCTQAFDTWTQNMIMTLSHLLVTYP